MSQKISSDYGESEFPDRRQMWTTFEKRDPDGRDLLEILEKNSTENFEANKSSMLKRETEGEEAMAQVSSIFRGIIV